MSRTTSARGLVLGDDLPGTFAQRQRLTAGLGYVFNKTWQLEVRIRDLVKSR